MLDRQQRCSRRKFLASAAALTLAGGVHSTSVRADDAKATTSFRARPPKLSRDGRKPIAVVCTVYRPLSHAYHIAGRMIYGYQRDGQLHVPKHYVASMSVDQTPDNDLSREVGKEFNIRITRSVAEALTNGGDKLLVDGVLLIGEHGNYPRNELGQILYPRFEMMEQIVEVFRKTGRSVPVFNDKHLSYDWDKARKMMDWAKELKFPLMAGSSLPVTWRRPELELPVGSPIEEALVAGYGPIEVYGFHALETLQVMLERRKGGETGVKAINCLTGNDVWKAGDAGQWSWDLLEAALSAARPSTPATSGATSAAWPSATCPWRPQLHSWSNTATARAAQSCCSMATFKISALPPRSRVRANPLLACFCCRRLPVQSFSTRLSPTSRSS
jgi:hypothetical protein